MNRLLRIIRSWWPNRAADVAVFDANGDIVTEPVEQALLLDKQFGQHCKVYATDGSLIADSRPDAGR